MSLCYQTCFDPFSKRLGTELNTRALRGVEVHREVCRECIERSVHLHTAKTGIIYDDSMQSKIVATVLGLRGCQAFLYSSQAFPH